MGKKKPNEKHLQEVLENANDAVLDVLEHYQWLDTDILIRHLDDNLIKTVRSTLEYEEEEEGED
jgi:hypothetical protein